MHTLRGKVGLYTGTGSAITLTLGFIPKYFKALNATDGDFVELWFDGMAVGTGVSFNAALPAVAGNPTNSVTRYTGAIGTTPEGLTLGTDLSETGKVYRYIAISDE